MKFVRPINTGGNPANISNPFGANHSGVDYAYPEGTKVYTAESGQILASKNNETRQWIANTATDPFRIEGKTRALRTEDYGNYIKIDHGNGYSTLYAHLKYLSSKITVGTKVTKGQLIAEVGSTGNSTGNHLHWETRLNEQTFDPSTNFDGGFTAYEDKVPAAQVAVEADVYPHIIHGSTEWDKASQKYLPDRNPRDTQAEDLDRVVAGIRSRTTDLEKQLADAQVEVANREEQVARLKAQCQESENLRLDLNKSLNDTLKKLSEVAGVYEGQLKDKQGTIDRMAKEKGTLNKQVAQLQTEIQNLKTKTVTALTISDLFMALAVKFAGKR